MLVSRSKTSIRKAGGILSLLMIMFFAAPAVQGQAIFAGCVGDCGAGWGGTYTRIEPGIGNYDLIGHNGMCSSYTLNVTISGAYNESFSVASGATFSRTWPMLTGQTVIISMTYTQTGSSPCSPLGSAVLNFNGNGVPGGGCGPGGCIPNFP